MKYLNFDENNMTVDDKIGWVDFQRCASFDMLAVLIESLRLKKDNFGPNRHACEPVKILIFKSKKFKVPFQKYAELLEFMHLVYKQIPILLS